MEDWSTVPSRIRAHAVDWDSDRVVFIAIQAHEVLLERTRSIRTAVMITAPIADPCQNGDTFSKLRPFRIITIISTPIKVPMMDPRPPYKLAPPITTAAIASSSSPVPATGSMDMTWAEAKVIATADKPPEII